MRRSHVQSSTIRTIGYDPMTATLELEFQNGSVYRYFLVPPSVVAELRAAPSIGAFVNSVIKPKYRCVRVQTEADHAARDQEREDRESPT